MSMDLVLNGMIVLLVNPTSAELSHWMRVLGFGLPILMRACRSGTIYLEMVKRPASSASEADDMLFLIIFSMVRTGPLWRGVGAYSDIMMWEPARLQGFLTLS